jgi:hypothetical protein
VAAPAVEIDPVDREGNFLVRIGASYGFSAGSRFEIAPALYLDFTSEDVAIVAGATFARKF